MPNTHAQSKMILEHLKTHGSIDLYQAAELFGCFRLSARIFDLKEAGHKIDSVMIDGINRFGARTHFARYTLKKEKEAQADG